VAAAAGHGLHGCWHCWKIKLFFLVSLFANPLRVYVCVGGRYMEAGSSKKKKKGKKIEKAESPLWKTDVGRVTNR
jgi:hypothetical protein